MCIMLLTMALLASGCASTQSHGGYPTLKQTQLNVEPLMTRYHNAIAAGSVTLAERKQIDSAYAQYQSAFASALAAAGNNNEAPAPDRVKQLANQLIGELDALPI
jgi:hypothetical protein